jgi:aminocarboxymuconate-semialdehyde decarboxylase
VGADRVLFGTDTPFDMCGPALNEQLGNFTGTDEDRQAIAGRNAEKLFSLNRTYQS